jgi:hypothetical protein
MKNKKIIALAIVSSLVPLWFKKYDPIKKYIESNYHFKLDITSLSWNKIELHNVTINKNTYIKDISVSLNGPIVLAGGFVQIDKDATNNISAEHIKRDILASQIDVDLKYHGATFVMRNVEYSSVAKQASFPNGIIFYKGHYIKLIEGVINQEDKTLSVRHVSSVIANKYYGSYIDADKVLIGANKSISAESVEAGIVSGKRIAIDVSADSDFFNFHADSVKVNHTLIAKQPVEFHDVNVSSEIPIKEPVIYSNGVSIILNLESYSAGVYGKCSNWAQGLPTPRAQAIDSSINDYNGDLAFMVELKPDIKLTVDNTCSLKCSSNTIKQLFDSKGFKYTAYDSKGLPFERTIGINEKDWVEINDVSPELIAALANLEDRTFYTHKGILPYALQLSLQANMKAGGFKRGGSTITMQTAKNLWLSRDKSIIRKAEEILLASGLESCLTKDQILELYLNAVEFGPNVYGIGPAADYYFHKEPKELTKYEAFYLAMILPNPKKAVRPENGGLEHAQRLAKGLGTFDMVEEIAEEKALEDQLAAVE